MKKAPQEGFTLIELLVTVTLAGVLLGIAIPSFVGMSTRNRITTYANSFVASLNYARAEAIRRGSSITMCISSNGTSCASSGSWTNGWIVWWDQNKNGSIDSGEILRKSDALATSYTLESTSLPTSITFARDGTSSIGVFAVCHSGSTNGARAILITRLRARVGTDTDNDGIPNKDDGNNIASCTNP